MIAPVHFLLRVRQGGPLVPARLRWLDHAPLDPPDNVLDRGRLSPIAVVDIAGEDRPPEELFDRLSWRSGYRPPGSVPRPEEIDDGGLASLAGPDHWKFVQIVDRVIYRRAFEAMRDAEWTNPSHPVLRPRRRVDPAQLPMPNFDRENGP